MSFAEIMKRKITFIQIYSKFAIVWDNSMYFWQIFHQRTYNHVILSCFKKQKVKQEKLRVKIRSYCIIRFNQNIPEFPVFALIKLINFTPVKRNITFYKQIVYGNIYMYMECRICIYVEYKINFQFRQNYYYYYYYIICDDTIFV